MNVGHIRQASTDDAPALLALINRAFAVEKFFVDRDRIAPEQLDGYLASGTFFLLEGHGASIGVLRLNGHPVTMACAEPGPLFITADQWPDPGAQKREATWVASQAL